MKRFNPDDWVFVTQVPARARFIMEVGHPAIVLPLDRYSPKVRKEIDDLGLVLIRSLHTGFVFWWSENDLAPTKPNVVTLTIIDEGHHIPKLVDTERGYDPYNSVPCWRSARYAKY